jgi:hypothetical protein
VASSKNDEAAEEGSDRLGQPLISETDDANGKPIASAEQHVASAPNPTMPPPGGAKVVDTSRQTIEPVSPSSQAGEAPPLLPSSGPTPAQAAAGKGTVVLDVDSGILVPSFMGKSLRSAVEVAQQTGLEINVLGSGIARQQSPFPGSHLLSGQKVTIRFSH